MDKKGHAACHQILREGDTPRPAGAASKKEPAACAAELVAASPMEEGLPGRLWNAVASGWSPVKPGCPDGPAFNRTRRPATEAAMNKQELPIE